MKKSNYRLFLLVGLVFFLSIGYAVVSSVNLTISGSASGESRELKVYFDGAVDVSNSSKVTASASGKTGTASVSNLTLNETVTIKYLIKWCR